MSENPQTDSQLQQQLATRIRQAREQARITQQELAFRAGLPAPQTVSTIENGERAVKVVELVRIAEALHVTLPELLITLPPKPLVLWREAPDDERERAEIEARLLARCRNYHLAEQWAGVPHTPSFQRFALPARLDDYVAAETIAESVRTSLGLGSYPALSLVTVLEQKAGINVFYEKNLHGSAACFLNETTAVILVNASDAPWRRNYSIAHELFHLVTWDAFSPSRLVENPGEWQSVEKLANAFAAALLLPTDSLLDELRLRGELADFQPVDWVELARDFQVSTDALLWRLANLHQIERKQVQALLSDVSFARLDRMSFTKHPESELLSGRFLRLLFAAHEKGKVTVARMADMAGLSLVDMRRLLAEAVERDEGDGIGQTETASA